MTDEEIIALAKSLGWNVEHAQTNRMLVLFAREIFSKERALFDAALLNSRPGALAEPEQDNRLLMQAYRAVQQQKEQRMEPEQEPVAWISKHDVVYPLDAKDEVHPINELRPLYTHPPQRKPLTDEEINELPLPPSGTATVRDIVRLIEAAHGIKQEEA